MTIEKDEILNKWIIWKIEGSIKTELFHANTKRECLDFLERLKNERKRL